MAKIWATNSYAERKKVGALIVKDNMIISDGYNGTPNGFENECETWAPCGFSCTNLFDKDCEHCKEHKLVSKPYVLHAEANAITKIARSGNNSDGATLYVTDSPCIECSKLIIQAGIKRVVYSREYRLTDGIDLLQRAGVAVEFLPLDNE